MLRREIIDKYFSVRDVDPNGVEKVIKKTTKCGWYLLPVLGHIPQLKPKGLYMKDQLGENLIDIYIIDDKDSPKLVLVFDYKEEYEDDFIFFRLQNDHTFISSDQDIENEEVWFIHNIPNEFKSDYNKFKEGKYSQFSSLLKERLMSAHGKYVGQGLSKTTGLPSISVYESLFPDENKEKVKILANHLGVRENKIEELLQSPDLDFEIFKPINKLQELYGERLSS